jgi:hypothetical protein
MALSISYIALWVAIENIPKEEFEKEKKDKTPPGSYLN